MTLISESSAHSFYWDTTSLPDHDFSPKQSKAKKEEKKSTTVTFEIKQAPRWAEVTDRVWSVVKVKSSPVPEKEDALLFCRKPVIHSQCTV